MLFIKTLSMGLKVSRAEVQILKSDFSPTYQFVSEQSSIRGHL